MVQLVTAANRGAHERLLDRMFEDRKAVFVDLLGWDIPHDGCREFDQFDDQFAEYMIVANSGTSEHLASLRMLRTDRPHILQALFAELCDGPVPCGPEIREISRLCLSPRHRGPERLEHRRALASAMAEYALLMGINAYTAVTDMARMSRLLSVGWRCEPLGMPRRIGRRVVCALIIYIEADTIRRLRAAGSYHCSTLRIEERSDIAA